MPQLDLSAAAPALPGQPLPSPAAAAPPALAMPPAAAPAPMLRDITDVPATRAAIFDSVLKAAQAFEPIENDRYRLELKNVRYVGSPEFSERERKQAAMVRGTLGRPLRGVWQLSDRQGNVLSKRDSVLARVPWLTRDGTYVNNGTEYGLANQLRLLPGVYTRQRDSGELEAHVNVKRGRSSKIYLDPQTGQFKLQIEQSHLPLVPLLNALGVDNKRLQEAWGNDLLAANQVKSHDASLLKYYTKFVGQRGKPDDDVRTALREAFARMEVDPDVMRRTLGVQADRMSPDILLAATQKLLRINRGEAKPDERDAMQFQRFLGPEDLLSESIQKARGDVRKAFWKASAKGTLDGLPSGLFRKAMQSVLLDSGLGQALEEINPLEVLDQTTRVTRLGAGGLPGTDSIPMSSRNVHPSQLGLVDTLRTSESLKVGVDLRLAAGARKGSDGKLYAPVLDMKTGERVYRSAGDLADAVVALPGQLESKRRHIWTLSDGRLEQRRRDEVTYAIPEMTKTYSHLTNLVPQIRGIKGGRSVMASRMITQALPLVNGEAPLVRSAADESGESVEQQLGVRAGAIRTTGGGRVLDISSDAITIRTPDGKTERHELSVNLPLNRKTLLNQTPVVQIGQELKPGELVARSNFTNDKGEIALGLNARVALMTDGSNYEDAVTVSQSFADRLKSEHAYQHTLDWSDRHIQGRKAFVTHYPAKYSRDALAKLDDNGVIRPGSEVHYGEPLVLALEKRPTTHKSLRGGSGPAISDASVVWEHHTPGVVTDAIGTDRGANVVVRAAAPSETGDKISGRSGNKGVIVVKPDNEMPTDASGRPFDALINPLGTISRGNPTAIAEISLGKLAALTGQPQILPDFSGGRMIASAKEKLKAAGLSSTEEVTDPRTGRKIPKILTGQLYLMKLHHTVESKNQGRGLGSYTSEEQPSKSGSGDSDSAKRLGMLQLHALLAHGAVDVLRDASLIRGQANPDLWAKYISGYEMSAERVPFVYNRFVNMLRQAGINPVRSGTQTQLMALRRQDIDEMVGDRELKNADTVDWKTFKPVPGGLFDERATGGHGAAGDRWSYIKLTKPLPNPLMEEPIRRLLGLTQSQYEDVLSGKQPLGGLRGPDALTAAIKRLDVPTEIEKARQEIASGRKSRRDAAVKRLRYLRATERLGIEPSDWMWDKVPVIPPAYRPVSLMGGDKKLPLVSDANYLYKELFDADRNYRDLATHIGDDGASDELLQTYNALRAVAGYGAPTSEKLASKNVRGALRQIIGSSPKTGYVQRKLLGKTVDLVGRSVIAPDPDLGMDEIGLPEAKAWSIYQPAVSRVLVRRGKTPVQALREIKERTPLALSVLKDQMESRPVLVSRDPVLHRFGFMALKPRLARGNAMRLNPVVYPGYGADNDGDALNFHLPQSDDAAREALAKMLPSKNLLGSKDFKAHYLPQQEFLAGLYEASTQVDTKRPEQYFDTVKDALAAHAAGEIDLSRRVVIRNPEE